ncbi:MAG: hypothetical protein AAF533_15260 [Acidobacteriota bacterium]
MPTYDAQRLADLLDASGLAHAGEAADALLGSRRAEVRSDGSALAEALHDSYFPRQRKIAQRGTPHARQLADSIGELCRSLRGRTDRCSFVNIPGPRPYTYTVVMAGGRDGPVLGCLKGVVRTAVSDAEWRELWGEEK